MNSTSAPSRTLKFAAALAAGAMFLSGGIAQASIAYGSINNFDTVNDTGHECHGFEIELDDIHSTDITYTYNYNHYGVSQITEDNSVAGHPKTIIRWESKKNSDGTWAAYTAIPAGPIPPTQGHQFTNPAVNFGVEHFGAGYKAQPSAVLYNWLIDGGSGTLVHGGAVQVSTPTFTYYPPVVGAAAQVSAAASYTFTATADRTLVANFTAVPTYTVATSATPTAGGTTTGDGTYSSGSSATVVATATPTYDFTKWTVGGTQVSTSPSYTFTVTVNKTLVANFIIAGQQKTITTSANPVAGGTTTGGGSYVTGDSATVVATANPGYQFSKWQEGGSNVSGAPPASYTFTVSGNRTLVAKFNQVFSITASALPAVGGSTEMDSLIYKTGDTAQARAFPASGYTFANWTENGIVVNTANPYSFPANGNRVLVANFTSNTGVTITTNSAPSAGGSTTGAGAYVVNDSVTVSALPNAGYAFVNWTVGGAIVSTSADYTFTTATNVALVAHFGSAVTITATGSPAAGGTILGAGDYVNGASATLEAVANPDFIFTKWTEGGATVSTTPSYTFNVTAARTLVANFTSAYTITASEWPVGGGTALGAATVTTGSSITLAAVPAAGYSFVNWTDASGTEVSATPSFTFTPTASGGYTANFSAGSAGIHFDFDSAAPALALHTAVPFTQTVAGLTASFSSPNAAPPTIETAASTGHVLSKFSGHFLAPSASTPRSPALMPLPSGQQAVRPPAWRTTSHSIRGSRPPHLKSATTALMTARTITPSASRPTACIFPSRTTGRTRPSAHARAATVSRPRSVGLQAASAGRSAISLRDSRRISTSSSACSPARK